MYLFISMSEKKSKKVAKAQEECPEEETEYAIKPEKGMPAIDTSSWPLLLKVINICFLLTRGQTRAGVGCGCKWSVINTLKVR